MALFAQSVLRERHAGEVFANVAGSGTLRQGFGQLRFMAQRSACGTAIDPLPELRIVLKVEQAIADVAFHAAILPRRKDGGNGIPRGIGR